MGDVVELGVAVKTSGTQDLDRLNLKLVETATNAKKTNEALDFGGSKRATSIAAYRAAMEEAAKGADGLGRATTATSQSMNIFQRAWAGVTGIFGGYNLGIGQSTSATHGFRSALHLLAPVAYSAGAGIQGLGIFSSAARGGIAILAAAITASLIVSLEKAADGVKVLRGTLEDLAGSKAGGAEAFDKISQSATKTRSSMDDTASSVARLTAIMRASKPGWVSFDSSNLVASGGALRSLETLSELIQLGGKNATTAKTFIDSYLTELEKIDPVTGKSMGLTKELFDKIMRDSSRVGVAIAKAFGYSSFDGYVKFSERLARDPKTIGQLLEVLNRIGPAVDANFREMKPNVTQSFDRLKTSILELWGAIGESSAGGSGAGFFTGIGEAVGTMTEKIRAGQGVWSTFWTEIKSSFNAPENDLMGQFVTYLIGQIAQAGASVKQSITDNLVTPVRAQLSALWASLTPDAQGILTSIGGFITAFVSSVVSGITSLVNAAKSLLGSMRNNGDVLSAGGPGSSYTGPSFAYNPSEYASTGYATGGVFEVGSGGAQQPVQFKATPGEIVSINPNGTGAPGGIFTVQGSGGTDSQLVRFRAMAGEIVTITPPGLTSPYGLSGATETTATGNANGAPTKAITNSGVVMTTGGATTSTVASNDNATSTFWRSGKAGSASNPLGSGSNDAWGNAVPNGQGTYVAQVQMINGTPHYIYAVNNGQAMGTPSIGGGGGGGEYGGGDGGGATDQVKGQVENQYTGGRVNDYKGGVITDYPYAKNSVGAGYYGEATGNGYVQDYGNFAGGGSFVVGGRTRSNTIGKAQPININIYGANSPQAFIAAERQIKRTVRRAFG